MANGKKESLDAQWKAYQEGPPTGDQPKRRRGRSRGPTKKGMGDWGLTKRELLEAGRDRPQQLPVVPGVVGKVADVLTPLARKTPSEQSDVSAPTPEDDPRYFAQKGQIRKKLDEEAKQRATDVVRDHLRKINPEFFEPPTGLGRLERERWERDLEKVPTEDLGKNFKQRQNSANTARPSESIVKRIADQREANSKIDAARREAAERGDAKTGGAKTGVVAEPDTADDGQYMHKIPPPGVARPSPVSPVSKPEPKPDKGPDPTTITPRGRLTEGQKVLRDISQAKALPSRRARGKKARELQIAIKEEFGYDLKHFGGRGLERIFQAKDKNKEIIKIIQEDIADTAKFQKMGEENLAWQVEKEADLSSRIGNMRGLLADRQAKESYLRDEATVANPMYESELPPEDRERVRNRVATRRGVEDKVYQKIGGDQQRGGVSRVGMGYEQPQYARAPYEVGGQQVPMGQGQIAPLTEEQSMLQERIASITGGIAEQQKHLQPYLQQQAPQAPQGPSAALMGGPQQVQPYQGQQPPTPAPAPAPAPAAAAAQGYATPQQQQLATGQIQDFGSYNPADDLAAIRSSQMGLEGALQAAGPGKDTREVRFEEAMKGVGEGGYIPEGAVPSQADAMAYNQKLEEDHGEKIKALNNQLNKRISQIGMLAEKYDDISVGQRTQLIEEHDQLRRDLEKAQLEGPGEKMPIPTKVEIDAYWTEEKKKAQADARATVEGLLPKDVAYLLSQGHAETVAEFSKATNALEKSNIDTVKALRLAQNIGLTQKKKAKK